MGTVHLQTDYCTFSISRMNILNLDMGLATPCIPITLFDQEIVHQENNNFFQELLNYPTCRSVIQENNKLVLIKSIIAIILNT